MGFLVRILGVAVALYALIVFSLMARVQRIPHLSTISEAIHHEETRQRSQHWTLDGHLLTRFPRYGTKEFSDQCSWTMGWLKGRSPRQCSLSGQPRPGNSEGMAMWISDIVTASIVAQQAGCDFVFDYGPEVEMDSVIVPSSALRDGHVSVPNTQGPFYNWTVPNGFNCSKEERCFGVPHQGLEKKVSTAIEREDVLIAETPRYRFAYSNFAGFWINRTDYVDILRTIPGFNLETGMACSLGALFNLSPKAEQFQPDLFGNILPVLRDPGAFVMAVYVRTGLTDFDAQVEEAKNASIASAKYYTSDMLKQKADRVFEGAKSIEDKFLTENVNATLSRVVWMVLTDSQEVKQWAHESFDGKTLEGGVTRKVVTTASRGKHTRTHRNPSTADFAEGFLDWYLIGESDVVVSFGGESYGSTGALRTARPFYKEGSRRICVH